MSFAPCPTDTYLDYADVLAWCRAVAVAHPEWVTLEELVETPGGRPLVLLTIGDQGGSPDDRPGFWLDGGTHAAEWTSVMTALYTAGRWIEGLVADTDGLRDWFTANTAYVLPCICPDGYQAMLDGAPFIRSTLRPPTTGTVRHGLDPCDVDGDGVVRWMRWKDPSGPFVDDGTGIGIRRRTLDDDPCDAYFVCTEGEFVHWDGVRWTIAPLKFGLDLNRNFPSHWAPFSMFGMDSGAYPMSAPQSRATVDAVAARPFIAAAVSGHTYTGCILTQPYRKDSPIKDGDQRLMEGLAKDAVKGTDYKVHRVHPDFTYDASQPIVGVWSDALATTFGIAGYTLELWNPFKFCGLEAPNVAEFFRLPEPELTTKMFAHYASLDGVMRPWQPFNHPQLGPIEIGGFDYMRTLRNPPLDALEAELIQGFTVADRMRRALPAVDAQVACTAQAPGLTCVELVLSNRGYLATSGLARGEQVKPCPAVSAEIRLGEGVELVQGTTAIALSHLDGWGSMLVGGSGHTVYPDLPARGHRVAARWWVRGTGTVQIDYVAGRGGRGQVSTSV